MSNKEECQICYLKKCTSIVGERRRLEYIPMLPWVIPKEGSVSDCVIRRNLENHQREINKYKLPEIKNPY
jgi:hypothetical protein